MGGVREGHLPEANDYGAAIPARMEFCELGRLIAPVGVSMLGGGMVAVRCPVDLAPLMRRAGGTSAPLCSAAQLH
jgi:hypothetical protein